ncbi:MAG: hypothetical protein J6U54_05540 [Clostridiales bacterium]|nr:hypothetical protein [Clostridiales bacterium]
MNNELYHYGVMGMKWGIRRYQNPDGSLTPLGEKRFYKTDKYGRKRLRSGAIKYNRKQNRKNDKYVRLLAKKANKDELLKEKIKEHKDVRAREYEAFRNLHDEYYKKSRKRGEDRFYSSREDARRDFKNNPLYGSTEKSRNDLKQYISNLIKDDKRFNKTINLSIGSGTATAGEYAVYQLLLRNGI